MPIGTSDPCTFIVLFSIQSSFRGERVEGPPRERACSPLLWRRARSRSSAELCRRSRSLVPFFVAPSADHAPWMSSMRRWGSPRGLIAPSRRWRPLAVDASRSVTAEVSWRSDDRRGSAARRPQMRFREKLRSTRRLSMPYSDHRFVHPRRVTPRPQVTNWRSQTDRSDKRWEMDVTIPCGGRRRGSLGGCEQNVPDRAFFRSLKEDTWEPNFWSFSRSEARGRSVDRVIQRLSFPLGPWRPEPA